MYCEICRIKEAQDNLYKWCLRNLPVGRHTTKEEVNVFNILKKDNQQDRERLFGHKEYVWYLKVCNYDCR